MAFLAEELLLPLYQREELSSGGGPLAEEAPIGRGNHIASRLLYPAHGHAQVLRLDNHGYTLRLEGLKKGFGNLSGHPLLKLGAVGDDFYHSG